jgi:hypothetical protein
VSKKVLYLMQHFVYPPYVLFDVPHDRELSCAMAMSGSLNGPYCGLYYLSFYCNFDRWAYWTLKAGVENVIKECYKDRYPCMHSFRSWVYPSSDDAARGTNGFLHDSAVCLLEFMRRHCEDRLTKYYLDIVHDAMYFGIPDALRWLHDRYPDLWQHYQISAADIYAQKQPACIDYLKIVS